ncbi:MAG: hypothetical protein IH595_09420 [Bacteroidales bacterium]|nr:hypothetical protein [Bacteroidales bacterium]
MKKLLAFSAMAVFFLAACSSSGHELIGTWKVSKVETHFKDTNLPKAIITHIKDEQQQLSFKFINDSLMVLILDKNTHEAKWNIDSKTKVIKYYFDDQKGSVNTLGTLEGNEIVTESNTPLGTLTVIFTKQ